MKPRSRTPWLLLALLALVALVAACGSDSGDDTASDDTAADATNGDDTTPPADGSDEDPDKIVIGYQLIPNGDLVVKNQGWLEEAFPNTEIEWKLFDSGGSVNEAIAAGSIDIGLAGSSPVSRGLSNELPYQVPWIHAVIGEAEALVVDPDAGITSIADLEGKTIATPFASTTHFSLLAALEAEGVDPATVDIIDAEPDDIYAAWTRGDIDGTYVWNPNLALIIEEGGEVLITSAELAAQGKTTYDLAVVHNDFAAEHPGAVETWVSLQDRAVRLIQDDVDTAAEHIGAELNLTVEEVLPQIAGLVFLNADEQITDENLGGGLAANLFAAAEFNAELGEIDAALPESAYQDAVKVAFAEAAAGG